MTEELPFHQAIRVSTLDAHERTNSSVFMGALFGGHLALADYVRLLEQYWFVYNAIEDTSDALAGDPVAGDFVTDELRRVPFIAEDLRHYGVDEPRAVAATERYAARVRETVDRPSGFVAHHYTRYLGDIAGGQAVRVLLERQYGVSGAGAAFYDFSALGPVPAFRQRYRACLDAAPWDASERDRVITEVRAAYEFNLAMFADLADDVGVDEARIARSA